MCRRDLKILADIARHPLFGPCVRYITLDPLRLLKIPLGVSVVGTGDTVGGSKNSAEKEISASRLRETFDRLYHNQ